MRKLTKAEINQCAGGDFEGALIQGIIGNLILNATITLTLVGSAGILAGFLASGIKPSAWYIDTKDKSSSAFANTPFNQA